MPAANLKRHSEEWKAEVREAFGKHLPRNHPDYISYNEAARRLDTSLSYVTYWGTEGRVPSPEMARRYARTFGRDVRHVLAVCGHELDYTDAELTRYLERQAPELLQAAAQQNEERVVEAVTEAVAEARVEAVSGAERLHVGLKRLEREYGLPVLHHVHLEGSFASLTPEKVDATLDYVEKVLRRARGERVEM